MQSLPSVPENDVDIADNAPTAENVEDTLEDDVFNVSIVQNIDDLVELEELPVANLGARPRTPNQEPVLEPEEEVAAVDIPLTDEQWAAIQEASGSRNSGQDAVMPPTLPVLDAQPSRKRKRVDEAGW